MLATLVMPRFSTVRWRRSLVGRGRSSGRPVPRFCSARQGKQISVAYIINFWDFFDQRQQTAFRYSFVLDFSSADSVFLSHQISTSYLPSVFFSHNKSAPATSHSQPNRMNSNKLLGWKKNWRGSMHFSCSLLVGI